jgi:hypothetical protein
VFFAHNVKLRAEFDSSFFVEAMGAQHSCVKANVPGTGSGPIPGESEADSFTRCGLERPQIVQASMLVDGRQDPELKGVTKQEQNIQEGALPGPIGTD